MLNVGVENREKRSNIRKIKKDTSRKEKDTRQRSAGETTDRDWLKSFISLDDT